MIDLDFCINEDCMDFAMNNKLYCNDCYYLNIINILEPFLKGWADRVKVRRFHKTILTAQSFIIMKSVKKMLSSSRFLSSSYLTPDEGIIKHVIKKGDNIYCKKDQIAMIHLIGKYLNGKVFYSSYENMPLEIILGDKMYSKLFNIGILSMSKGEKSILIGLPEYCSSSYLNFPQDSTLLFEIELIEFREKKNISEMTLDERLVLMFKYKKEADELKNNNKLIYACELYKKSLEYLYKEDDYPEKIEMLDNLSTIYHDLQKWNLCLTYSKLALHTDTKNKIYLHRIAKVFFNLEKYDNCINICNKILYFENNEQIKELMDKCLSQKTFKTDNEKDIYNKMFNNLRDIH